MAEGELLISTLTPLRTLSDQEIVSERLGPSNKVMFCFRRVIVVQSAPTPIFIKASLANGNYDPVGCGSLKGGEMARLL